VTGRGRKYREKNRKTKKRNRRRTARTTGAAGGSGGGLYVTRNALFIFLASRRGLTPEDFAVLLFYFFLFPAPESVGNNDGAQRAVRRGGNGAARSEPFDDDGKKTTAGDRDRDVSGPSLNTRLV